MKQSLSKKKRNAKTSRGERRSSQSVRLDPVAKVLLGGGSLVNFRYQIGRADKD